MQQDASGVGILNKNRAPAQRRTRRIADNALIAVMLLIAESRAGERDVLVRAVVNRIREKNA